MDPALNILKLRNWLVFGGLNLAIIGVFGIGFTLLVADEIWMQALGIVISVLYFFVGVWAFITTVFLKVKYVVSLFVAGIIGLIIQAPSLGFWVYYMFVAEQGESYWLYALLLICILAVVFGILTVKAYYLSKAVRGDIWLKVNTNYR